jgi:hypothetical protein
MIVFSSEDVATKSMDELKDQLIEGLKAEEKEEE